MVKDRAGGPNSWRYRNSRQLVVVFLSVWTACRGAAGLLRVDNFIFYLVSVGGVCLTACLTAWLIKEVTA